MLLIWYLFWPLLWIFFALSLSSVSLHSFYLFLFWQHFHHVILYILSFYFYICISYDFDWCYRRHTNSSSSSSFFFLGLLTFSNSDAVTTATTATAVDADGVTAGAAIDCCFRCFSNWKQYTSYGNSGRIIYGITWNYREWHFMITKNIIFKLSAHRLKIVCLNICYIDRQHLRCQSDKLIVLRVKTKLYETNFNSIWIDN